MSHLNIIFFNITSETEKETGVKSWIDVHRNPNTKKSYDGAWKDYNSYTELPQCPVEFADFLIKKFENGRAGSTINGYAAAIASKFRLSVLPSPTESPLAKEVLKIINALVPPPQERLPVTTIQLTTMFQSIDWNIPRDTRDYCMIIWCYKGALRESECTDIKSAKIQVITTPDNYIQCQIDHNPTSSKKKGAPSGTRTKNKKDRTVLLPQDLENIWKCPWTIFHTYLDTMEAQAPRSDSPEFVFYNLKNGNQLSKTHVNHALQRLLKKIEMSHIGTYKTKSHDLRVRAATKAQQEKFPLSLIKEHGGWKSNAVLRYIKHTTEERILIAKKI